MVTHLESQWAWSRIEAMADGTLTAAEQQRMRKAMATDRQLCRAVEDAMSLRDELARLKRAPVPAALGRRLFSIPSGRPQAPVGFLPAAVGLAAVAALVVGLATLLQRTPAPAPAPAAQAQAEAVEDFAVAMTYLRRSAVLTSAELSTAVGDGLRDVLAVSREAARKEKREPKNGG